MDVVQAQSDYLDEQAEQSPLDIVLQKQKSDRERQAHANCPELPLTFQNLRTWPNEEERGSVDEALPRFTTHKG